MHSLMSVSLGMVAYMHAYVLQNRHPRADIQPEFVTGDVAWEGYIPYINLIQR